MYIMPNMKLVFFMFLFTFGIDGCFGAKREIKKFGTQMPFVKRNEHKGEKICNIHLQNW